MKDLNEHNTLSILISQSKRVDEQQCLYREMRHHIPNRANKDNLDMFISFKLDKYYGTWLSHNNKALHKLYTTSK